MSIRLRFTLLYTTILAVTLFLFGVTLYITQSHSTMNSLKEDIRQSGESIAGVTLWSYQHPRSFIPGGGIPPPIQADQLSGQQAFRESRERQYVRVLDANGLILASPFGANDDPLPISKNAITQIQALQVSWETATPGSERLLIYNKPVAVDGELMFIVQVARPLTEQDRSLATLSRTLIIASVLITALAFGIGWVLSGATLSPIHRITQTAQAIANESKIANPNSSHSLALSRRVDHKGPNDEIGQLATTFNTMLSTVEQAYQRVSQSLKSQREFVADVSHELRTPLTTVRGNLELLRRDPPPPPVEQQDILTDLVDESDRLIRLVNALLVMARVDAGFNLAKDRVPILPLMAEVCKQARQIDTQREVIESSQDICFLGDRDATKQVLLILLDNALKHSQGTIRMDAVSNGEQIEISVRDSGPGIPPEELAHVFDRFYRSQAMNNPSGFGLGLAIAKTLAESQKGRIDIQSQPGVGSTVRVWLPKSA